MDKSEPLQMEQIEALERDGHGLKQVDPVGAGPTQYALEEATVVVAADVAHEKVQGPRGVFPQLAKRVSPGQGATWLRQSISIRALLPSVPQLDLAMRET